MDINSNPPQDFATGRDLIFSRLSGLMDIILWKTEASVNITSQMSEKRLSGI